MEKTEEIPLKMVNGVLIIAINPQSKDCRPQILAVSAKR